MAMATARELGDVCRVGIFSVDPGLYRSSAGAALSSPERCPHHPLGLFGVDLESTSPQPNLGRSDLRV